MSALRRRPDAASAFAAMGHFGGSDSPSHGRAYEGSVGTRLVSFLTEPDRGSPLRALTRRAAAGTSLRLPSDAIGGFWANEPYLLRLLSAGPVLHCPDNLYLRWDKRSGGLTDGWKRLTPQEVCAATRSLAAAQLQALADAKLDAREHAQLAYVLQLNLMSKVWGIEKEYRIVPFSRPDAVHSALDPAWTPPPELAELEPRIQERIAKRRASMVARGLPIPGLEKR